MKIKEAIRLALLHCRREGLLPGGVWGQDSQGVGPGARGGVLAETQGLDFAHNTILNERVAAWLPYGSAFLKQPSVGVMQFPDYQHNTYDILKVIGETCWSTAGRVPMPMVIMAAYGALGGKGALYHSQTPENEMIGLPGWKVVSASTPNDAATLLVAAIKDPNPVYFMYPRAHSGLPTDSAMTKGLAHLELPGFEFLPGQRNLMEESSGSGSKSQWYSYMTAPPDQRDGSWIQNWPEGLSIPEVDLEQVGLKIRKDGDFAVIFSHGRMMPMCWKVAEVFSFISGKEVAVVDLRVLKPIPFEEMTPLIKRSRGRVLFVNEATGGNNWMHTLNQRVLDELGWEFDMFPQVLTAKDSPVGQALAIEKAVVPQIEDVLVSLFNFLTPDQVIQVGQRVSKEMTLNHEKWFEPIELKALANEVLDFAQKNHSIFKESINPLKSLAKVHS